MFHSAIAHVEPVPYTYWYNANEDRKASLFGACPWFDGSGEANWSKVTAGYTLRVEHKDGSVTYGLGRRPFENLADAEAFAARVNDKHGA